MIPRLHKRGKSFKEALRYVLHDVKENTTERVDWSLTRNLVSHADDAWFEMFETYRAQDALKAAAGVDARGRKNESPVLHYSLSWAPGETPSAEQMQEAALGSLKALGLSEHEAVIVGHSDRSHPHVHLVVNTVHPYSGRTAEMKFSTMQLSRWAEAYEKEHGIVCETRIQNNADRQVLREQRNAEHVDRLKSLSRGEFGEAARYVPVTDRSLTRGEWEAAKRRSPEHVLETLTRHHSTFSRADLAREVMQRTRNREEFKLLMDRVEGSDQIVRLAGEQMRYSTRDMVHTERQLGQLAIAMGQRHSHPGKPVSAEQLTGPRLSGEQQEVLTGITGPEQLVSLIGYAGTGKSTLLGGARQVWEKSGYRVLGAALSGIAAEGLQSGSGIESGTVFRLLRRIESGRETLTASDVLVIDEAGMVGSRDMRALLSAADKASAKVVLVGDPEQLQAIQAGAAFRAIAERSTVHALKGVRRQQIAWQREATVDLAEARTTRALAAYDDAGRIKGYGARADALAGMAQAWTRDQYQTHPGETSIMMTGTNAAAAKLNAAVRAQLKAAGRLGREKGLRAVDEGIDRPRTEFDLEVAIGDRLLFTKNDGPLGVKNGTLGTVVAFGSTSIRCQIGGDRPRIVDVDLTRYRNLTHGYAVTVHKAQGVTVDRAHVLAEPNMDRHGTYVALSRHRRNVQMHWAQDDFSTRGNMVDRLSRERLKDTTLDYAAGREVKPLVPVRDAGPLQRSVSREFSQAKSSSSSSTSRSERAAMTQWRSRKGGGLDFGRER